MRVFVAGATGIAGKRAVARLAAAGHEVTGIARTSAKEAQLAALGARSVGVSLFDADGLRAAVAGHDAVVNLATKIPPVAKMAQMSAWSENEKIRREGSGLLVDAAIAAGATVFVQESLAFLYGEHGAEVIDASTTQWMDTPFTDAMRIAEANVARFTEHGGRGVVLRFGRFYAPESEQSRATLRSARRGLLLDLGRPDGYAPQIDADDVATAVVAALAAPAGVYDVVDDEPLTRAEQAKAMANAVGRRRLWSAPAWIAPKKAAHLASSQRVSNERFRAATSWQPASPSGRAGFKKLFAASGLEPAQPGRVRLMLWILVVSVFGVGVQAAFFPRSFYDDFPYGRGWVALDGPYNQHLVRDVGALNLALLVLTIGALFVATRVIVRITAVAWLVYSVPHFVYHLRHLTMNMAGADKVGIVVSLAITVIAPLVILIPVRRVSDDSATGGLGSSGEARALQVSRA